MAVSTANLVDNIFNEISIDPNFSPSTPDMAGSALHCAIESAPGDELKDLAYAVLSEINRYHLHLNTAPLVIKFVSPHMNTLRGLKITALCGYVSAEIVELEDSAFTPLKMGVEPLMERLISINPARSFCYPYAERTLMEVAHLISDYFIR